MKELLSNLYKKIGAATQEWLAEREADQKRLDWIGTDGARMELVHAKMRSMPLMPLRVAIDHAMTEDATPPEET